ncbi:MAG: TIGR03790 family protein [Fimbriiglobus sp.]|jgi:uncharacterized protein (TIGR03790 family)|nr:TIGR03790 family protein [Fimbriiglobus sp.]
MRSLAAVLLLAAPIAALEPKDVFIVCNKDVKDSRDVAAHYVMKRKVPAENVIELSLPKSEDISREDYNTKLAGPLREALKGKKDACKLILCVYGVPLRVGAQMPSREEKEQVEKLKPELDEAKKRADDAKKDKKADEAAAAQRTVDRLNRQIANLQYDQSTAAVDSELMCLWWPKYELTRWQMNPLFWQVSDADRKKSPTTLLTCRLDGPTSEIAKRLVDDALTAETNGLKGKAYFDARGMKLDVKNQQQWTGYQGYDEAFREAAELMNKAGFEVILDDKDPVFPKDSCPDAALYAGWYSHANFVDSCTFPTGAVAWHLASSEATTLRNKDSKVWCPNLLKKGAAVTMGPVGEPYTVAFPKAGEFFGFLATGKYTVAECFARTTILTSWMMTLVGDPLYNPFAREPKLKEDDVFASPKGGKAAR